MFVPVDQIFAPYRKLYMESHVIVRYVLGKYRVGRGEFKAKPMLQVDILRHPPPGVGLHLLSRPSAHNASTSAAPLRTTLNTLWQFFDRWILCQPPPFGLSQILSSHILIPMISQTFLFMQPDFVFPAWNLCLLK